MPEPLILARCLTPQRLAGHQPDPIFERDRQLAGSAVCAGVELAAVAAAARFVLTALALPGPVRNWTPAASPASRPSRDLNPPARAWPGTV